MPFVIAAEISINSRQSEKKVINSLNDCMVEIDKQATICCNTMFCLFI